MPWKIVEKTVRERVFVPCCEDFEDFFWANRRYYRIDQKKDGMMFKNTRLGRKYTMLCCPFCLHDFSQDTIEEVRI